MIEIKFNDGAVMQKLHKALVGSPAYINSEIALCAGDNDDFTLVVGNENDNNIVIEVDSYIYD